MGDTLSVLLVWKITVDANAFAVANELGAFPGENPKWKGAAKCLKHMSPAVEETPKNAQDEAGDPSKLDNEEPIPTSRMGKKAFEATTTTSVPKITVSRLDTWRKSEGKDEDEDAPVHLAQLMSSKSGRKSNSRIKALKVPAPVSVPTPPTSGANKRKLTETQLRISDDLKSPEYEQFIVDEDQFILSS